MGSSSPSLRAWAQRLLAVEAAASELGSYPPAAIRVFQRLQLYLTRLIGADGFASLQRRALLLARAEIPSLDAAKVTAKDSFEGIAELSDGDEAAAAITAHLLGLLIALIGESLTLRLMLDAFPDAPRLSIGEPQNLS